LYFATLPYYYSTFWDAGVPYYYSDDNYYQWDGNVGQYKTVNPPAEVQRQAEQQSSLIAYPKSGQTQTKQATDKTECQAWAASQSDGSGTYVGARTILQEISVCAAHPTILGECESGHSRL
jgi:hypothetical protein